MTSIVYFGSEPTSTTLVSKELLSRNINLCRAAPSSLNIIGLKSFTHPSYELFIQYLPLAIQAARTATPIEFGSKEAYYPYNGKNVPIFVRSPAVVWTYGEKKPNDFLENQKARFNAVEVTAGGKPALRAVLSPSQVRDLIKDTSPLMTTNISSTSLNLQGFIVYRKLHALAHALCRTMQYALTDRTSKLAVDRASQMVAVPNDFGDVPTGWTTHKTFKKNLKSQFHMNLPQPYATYNHVIKNSNEIPNQDGLIFAFVPELARDDDSTVPNIVSGPLRGLFGSDAESAGAAVAHICKVWKDISITQWGWELTHLYTGIELSLQTGAAIRTFTTPHNVYAGFILCGSYFNVFVRGKNYEPQSFAVLQKDFGTASPHTASLTALLEKINFPTDIERQGALAACSSLYDVGVLIRKHGYNINDREEMARNASRINFPKDVYLQLNPGTVARVFNAMASGLGESDIPLHHLALFKTNRSHRLLSAFGVGCPSFMIEGGRKIELTGTFSYKKVAKTQGNKKVDVTVNTIHLAVKDFERACDDFDRMVQEKYVLTLAGTPGAAKVSARAMMREYESNGATEVIAAIRAAAGVVVAADPSSTNAKKRKAEEELAAETSKKVRDFFDEF